VDNTSVHIARLLFDRRVDRLANVLADIRLCETVTLGFQDGRRRESVPAPIGRDTQLESGVHSGPGERDSRPRHIRILDLAEQPMVL